MSGYPPIADLVPHAAPILMLEALTRWEPGFAECGLVLRDSPEGPFAQAGFVDAVVTLEIMAQAVAACLGYEAYLGGAGVRVGMIVGCRRLALQVDRLAVGTALVVTAQRQTGDESVSRFQCAVVGPEGPVADASLTLFHAEHLPA